MNFAIASYGYSTGNILLDNSLPIEDLKADLHNLVVAYARSLSIFDRPAKVDLVVPYSFGEFQGETILNGVEKNDEKDDWRYGGAFAYRINKQNALKVVFTTGLSTRYGADFTSFLLAYQFIWLDKMRRNQGNRSA